jgi:hypothetical protein
MSEPTDSMALRGGRPRSNSTNVGAKGEAIRGNSPKHASRRQLHQGNAIHSDSLAVLLRSLRRRTRKSPPIQIGSPQSKAPAPPASDVTAVFDSLGLATRSPVGLSQCESHRLEGKHATSLEPASNSISLAEILAGVRAGRLGGGLAGGFWWGCASPRTRGRSSQPLPSFRLGHVSTS